MNTSVYTITRTRSFQMKPARGAYLKSSVLSVRIRRISVDRRCKRRHMYAFLNVPWLVWTRSYELTVTKSPARASVSVSDSFWSNVSAISSRSRQNGLQYAVEGYIQNIKINNKGDTTIIEAKAHRSQSKNEKPHDLFIKCHQLNLVD